MSDSTARCRRLAAGVYQVGEFSIERIDADHEVADTCNFLPAWRVANFWDILGEFDTKREALAAIEAQR